MIGTNSAEYSRAYRKRNAENPEYKERRRKQSQRYAERYPGKVALRMRRLALSRFGLTLEDLERMEQEQSGRCAICGESPESSLNVDHDHETGRVRGLLCGLCNRGLGMFKDNPESLTAAAEYLTRAS